MRCRVSVIIPMYNAANYIDRCLSSISKQTIKNFEIILVDDCSTDDTVQRVRNHPFDVIQLKERLTPGGVRNYGARYASGDILVFLDADVILKPDSIENIIYLLSEPGIDAISAIYTEDTPEISFFSQLQNLILVYRFSKLCEATVLTISSFCAIKKNAFETVDGYNEKMRYYEDVEIGHRLTRKGFRCKFNRSLAVTHLKYYNHLDLLREYFRKAVAMSNYVINGVSVGKIRGNGWPLSLKIASISADCILLSIALIKISIVPLLIFLSAYSISVAPLLFYLGRTRDLAFGLKSYFVFFEIGSVSIFGLVFGILGHRKNG